MANFEKIKDDVSEMSSLAKDQLLKILV